MKKISYILFLVLCVVNANAQTELVSTGSGSAYDIAYPAAFSYSIGITITFRAHATCNASPTLNINGLGVKNIKKNVSNNLAFGDILLNQYVTVIYDGTNFQLTSPVSGASTAWSLGGNAVGVATNFGTTTAYDLPFITGSVERMRIFSTGEVAIGNPPIATGAGFSVSGTGLWSSAISINNTSGGQDWRIASDNDSYLKFIKTSGATFTAMVMSGTTGNIGIGTSNPTAPLQINKAPQVRNGVWTGLAIVDPGSGANGIQMESHLGDIWNIRVTPNNAGDYMSFGKNTNNTLSLYNNYVGIGTLTPTAKLEVAGQIKITGGTPGVGKVLTSDGTGLATWITPTIGGDFMSTGSVAMVGQFLGSSGTAALPGISFSGDNDNGFYKPAVNQIGISTTGAERIRIDASGNVGIGTTVPSSVLQVAGKTTTTNFQMITGAVNNAVLSSDASGNATWKPMAVGFMGQGQVNQSIPATVNTVVTYDLEQYDDATSFNPATGIYTVPYTGFYHFDGGVYWTNFPGTRPSVYITVNGFTRAQVHGYCVATSSLIQVISGNFKLNAGDQVCITAYNNGPGATIVSSGGAGTFFSGFRVY